MADNWYIILELEFDPPVEDEQKIADKIDERAKFWSAHHDDFKMGAQYRAWLQNIPQIRKDMIGAANIRKQLAADACNIVYEPIDKFVKIIGKNGSITADEGLKLSEKLNVSIDVVKKRTIQLGIKWDENGDLKNHQTLYDKYYKTKPQKAYLFDGMKQMLLSFSVENLYDFLFADTVIKNANRLSCEVLRQRAEEKRKTEFYKNDSISGTGSKLCGQCKIVFKDESSKKTYDDYLIYTGCHKIFEYTKGVAEISGKLTSEQMSDMIEELVKYGADKQLAEDILISFCQIEDIKYSLDSEVDKSPINQEKRGVNHVYAIKNVNSIGGYDAHTPFPSGTYSSVIDIEKFKCVYFHIFLQKPVGISAVLKLNVLVYDANDNLVSDISTEINCEPIHNKFSKGLILRGDDGSCMAPGKYTAKISFEDSNTVTYHFELVQKKRKGLFGFFR